MVSLLDLFRGKGAVNSPESSRANRAALLSGFRQVRMKGPNPFDQHGRGDRWAVTS